MRRFIFSILFLLPLTTLSAQVSDSLKKGDLVFLISLKQDIDKAAMRKVNLGIRNAENEGAKYILFDINTYGGAVDAADSIRTAILQTKIPTIAFINVQAASAGALISIACDSIYMRSGSSIGAATVVNQNGEVMPDKFQSFMRGMMRSTAEAHGKKIIIENGVEREVWRRDPKIAQQMVDTANVLSFTQEEAIANHFCEGKAETIDEVVSHLSIEEPVIKEQTLSVIEKIILFFLSPLIQGILIMMIIGGIYFELQSPGIGLALGIAILGALLYFVPLYLYGLALNWEIVLFVVGVILLVLEIFLFPGFGVAGVSGIILIVTSLVFALVNNDVLYFEGSFNALPVLKALAMVLISLTAGLVLSIWGASKLYPKKSFSFIALKTELNEKEGWVGVETSSISTFVGLEVLASTDMNPSGKIEIEGKWYEAMMEYGSANKGDKIKIMRFEGGRLYCEKV